MKWGINQDGETERSTGIDRRRFLQSAAAGVSGITLAATGSGRVASAEMEGIDVTIWNFDSNDSSRANKLESAVFEINDQIGVGASVSKRVTDSSNYRYANNWKELYNDFAATENLTEGVVNYLIYDRKDMNDWNRGYGHGGESMPFADEGQLMYEQNKTAVAFIDADLYNAAPDWRAYKNVGISELGRTMMDRDNSPAADCGLTPDINSFGVVGPDGGSYASPLMTGKTGCANWFSGGNDDAKAHCRGCSDPPTTCGNTGTLSGCSKDEIRRWLKYEY